MSTRSYILSNQQALACFQHVGSRRVEIQIFDIEEIGNLIPLFQEELMFLKILMGKECREKVVRSIPLKATFKVTIKEFQASIRVEHELGTENIRFKALGDRKVLIIDDSRTMRKILSKSIDAMEGFSVSATAESSIEARSIIEKERPDVITLDLHMPGENGVEFLKSYLGSKNIPTILITSVTMDEGPLVMDALSSGAMTYIQKPEFKEITNTQQELRTALKQAANYDIETINKETSKKTAKFVEKRGAMIVIGSSTGGVGAIEKILTSFPQNIPPILIVQHIPATFSKAFAERLDSLCPFIVKEAEDGEIIQRNCVYISPGGLHMRVDNKGSENYISVSDGAPRNNFKPSVDVLFESVPRSSCKSTTAVILTGMGYDGAKGLLKLKELGSYTIAQDRATSVVFGMPKEAISIGAVIEICPLGEIADSISKRFSS